MNFINSLLSKVLYLLPAALISLPIHEFAHGYVSYKYGDPTAKAEGRLTLNPLKHLDPIGFIMLLIIGFGWAKPVPINPTYYKNRKLGIVMVSLAGPLSNLILAFISLLILKIFGNMMQANVLLYYLATFLEDLVWLNIILAVFNLIPIPPLDGSKILMCALPTKMAYSYSRLEQYGIVIILALSFLNLLGPILQFMTQYIYMFFQFILNLL